MDKLFDSLSEDWVSEPRSSNSISVRNDSPAPSNSSQQNNVSQSRIPRYNYRSASGLGTSDLTSSKRRSSGSFNKDPKNALSEKSSSYMNASHSQVKGSSKFDIPPGLRSANKRHTSTSSLPPTLQDTIQHKPSRPSPAKGLNIQATPDWKRRVLQGNVAPGEKCDLFSPIGLENVFRPPTVKTKVKPQRSTKSNTPEAGNFPSSPPPYPMVANKQSASRSQNPKPLKLTENNGQTHRDFQTTLQKKKAPMVEAEDGVRSKQITNIASSSRPAPSSPSSHSVQRPTSARSFRLGGRSAKSKDTMSPDAFLPHPGNKNAGINGFTSRSEQSRNSRDQGQDRAEIISPLYVSRHHTMDGRVDFAALDMSQNQIRIQIDKARLKQQSLPSPLSDNGVDYVEAKSPCDPLPTDIENHEWTSQSLPDDLSMGTDAFAANGGFINVRRGGYSNDGSFQRRALSPSSLPPFDASDMMSSVSVGSETRCTRPGDTSYQDTPVRPLVPTTPKRHGTGESDSQKQVGSSGSPLKLFDKYDTFTNDRLYRRMSKFEEDMSQLSNENVKEVCKATRPSRSKRPDSSETRPPQSDKRVSSFGQGMLDHQNFSSPQPPTSDPDLEQDEHRDDSRRQSLSNSNDFSFHREPSLTLPYRRRPSKDFSSVTSRNPSQKPNPNLSRPQQDHLPSEDAAFFAAMGGEIEKGDLRNAQGKRLPRSPAKDPQPKRRRTLPSAEELDDGDHQLNLQGKSKMPLATSMVGRKRKDALYDGQNQAADPKVLAMRTILRPRTSANSQNTHQNLTADGDNVEEAEEGEMKTLKDILLCQDQFNMETPTKALAEELATFTLNMTQDIAKGSRKVSVTTADFFNEAEQIMQLIRAQARPQSSHRNFEEAEGSREGSCGDSLVEESTRDEFSRPPSREGASLRRMREPAQVDARVISHLRRFEEKDEFELALSSSLKSLRVNQASPLLQPSNDQTVEFNRDGIESDPPNLRIVDSQIRPEGHQFSLIEDVNSTKLRSVASQSTSNPSTGRSLNTGSSRGSKNKAVIAPETVSHLLSDQMAGMKYDQDRQVWVKFSASSARGSLKTNTASEMTEDPLAEIPDLSVDELEEMQRIKNAACSMKSMGSSSKGISNHDYEDLGKLHHKQPSRDQIYEPRPRTAETATTAHQEDSSAPSKYSRFASSGPIPETRATSWGDDMLNKNSMEAAMNYPEAPGSSHEDSEDHEDRDEEVEHEISILEGRVSTTPTRLDRRECQPRVVTVAFSSPLVEPKQAPYQPNFGPEIWQDEGDLYLDESPVRVDRQPSASATRRSASFARKSGYRNASRRVSIGNQSYLARPMSRLDEQDEIAFLQCSDRAQDVRMDVVVSTPLPSQGTMVQKSPSMSFQSSVGFHLSPLADFTMHQTDGSFNGVRHVARSYGLMPRHEVEDKYALATQALVKQLTDLEPYEPYWDFIRSISLRDRGLVTLHALDEFCGRTEELDVSNNSLEQLDGAPSTIRDLKICHNYLTDLTAWGHLYNLQYLDVSRNRIQSLKGFQGLIHLRELKADNNQIESLDGICELDGLISLSLRGNCVDSIDFEASNLKRLTDLDLRRNKVGKVANLQHLTALKHLDLSENRIQEFESFALCPLRTLESLNISSNSLRTINTAHMPNLQTLNIDKISISIIIGLTQLKRLVTLSWREQILDSGSPFTEIQYQDCRNIHNLHLSSNALSSFSPNSPFLNLRNLELASTGLKTLAPNFGQNLPNLRVLNLNYNAVRDLRPLLGIVKLQKVFLAGNRISRLRQTTMVFERLGMELGEVDLRRNPLTTGFYTPQESTLKTENQIALQALDHAIEDSPENSDVQRADEFLLPAIDKQLDSQSRARLDEDTKLRRRVYEMMIVSSCRDLKVLDGMEAPRKTLGKKDGVWDRLLELGILKERGLAVPENEEMELAVKGRRKGPSNRGRT